MGSTKRHQKPQTQSEHNETPNFLTADENCATSLSEPPVVRSRTTRSKGRLLTDPAQNTQLLTSQLRSLGLYAAPTLGDGNCLFRALSDQLYGTPSHHLQLRKDICDWIEAHKTRYEPFVEDERGIDVHLKCMRENATYGGHMELSAFAHLMRRNVKVIQPGLVYVIEWAAGGDPASFPTSSSAASANPREQPDPGPNADLGNLLDDRERRHLRRDRKRAEKERERAIVVVDDAQDDVESLGPIYVAYHDWEHFSSIRNLKGPHSGLPSVHETPPHPLPNSPLPKKKPVIPKVKLRLPSSSSSSLSTPSTSSLPKSISKSDPFRIPLPPSRSPTPSPPSTSTSPPISASLTPHAHRILTTRTTRSPKRSFDESSAGSEESEGRESVAKRTRSGTRTGASSTGTRTPNPNSKLRAHHNHSTSMDVDSPYADPDPDADTPGLSAPSSGSGSSSSSDASEASEVSSVASSPPPTLPQPQERPLTRRQRKTLGLPKPRVALSVGRRGRGGKGAGKIVIPGGRYGYGKGITVGEEGDGDGDERGEWKRNGTGRVDVRGFRELKI